MGTELPATARHTGVSDGLDKPLQQRLGELRWRRTNERRTPPLSRIPQQRELAHHKDFSPDIGNGAVHLPVIIGEDPQLDELASQRYHLSIAIAGGHPHQHGEAIGDLAYRFPIHPDRSPADSLHHCSHEPGGYDLAVVAPTTA
jgi:hypothetical protein